MRHPPSRTVLRQAAKSIGEFAGNRIPFNIKSEKRASHRSRSSRLGSPKMASLIRRTVSRSCFCDSLRLVARLAASMYFDSAMMTAS